MNILMMSNTYTPIVGGLERSVKNFTAAYRRRGHRVLVVAPKMEGMPKREEDVVRIPSFQSFDGSAFAIKLPVPAELTRALVKFRPDIIHAHHPFLVGNTALRLAHTHKVPLVFTHHTLFEQYTHFLPIDTPAMQRFVVELATGYANLCDRVFAPSESVATLLQERGVETPIDVVPTGLVLARFGGFGHSRGAVRASLGVPADAFVVGHVGRLSPEKNLEFLSRAVATFLSNTPRAHFLVIGQGPSEEAILHACQKAGAGTRVHMAGTLSGPSLAKAYSAMDVFAFASKSETQGLVVTEAMASGVPVVAIDASGVREVVEDRRNGRLLAEEHPGRFAEALAWVASRSPEEYDSLRRAARATAERFSMARCADRALEIYASLRRGSGRKAAHRWTQALRRVRAEWDLLKNAAKATGAAVLKKRRRHDRSS